MSHLRETQAPDQEIYWLPNLETQVPDQEVCWLPVLETTCNIGVWFLSVKEGY